MKTKKILSMLLTLILSFGICSVAFAVEEIPEGYMPVYTAEDLNNIRNNLSGKYILMNDIDLSECEEWETLGGQEYPFKGELDGNGYSIIGLKAKESFFGRIDSAVIKNLGIINAAILQPEETASTISFVGILANSVLNSTISNCFSSGKILACVHVGWMDWVSSCNVGGLAGVSKNSSFINCYSITDINFQFDKISDAEIGGLVGNSIGSCFSCCYSVSNISINDESVGKSVYVGNMVGAADDLTEFSSCYYTEEGFSTNKDKNLYNGVKYLSDSEMKVKESFVGFDFENVWNYTSDNYPYLRFEKTVTNKDIAMNYKEKTDISQYVSGEISSWTSSDNSVAVLDDSGYICGLKVGKTSMTVFTRDNGVTVLNIDVSYNFWQRIIVYFLFGWLWY